MKVQRSRWSVVSIAAWLALTPAYAGSGWYLLTPPFRELEGSATKSFAEHFDWNAPLREWEQDSAYDTAKECEISRSAHIAVREKGYSDVLRENAKKPELKNLPWSMDPKADVTFWALRSWEVSVCIASDDPRLK